MTHHSPTPKSPILLSSTVLTPPPETSSAFAAIDWQQPWMHPWRTCGEPLARKAQEESTLAALQSQADSPVRFVPQSLLPDGQAYESYIFETHQCPVREGLHDFFNGLCWLHFPQSKRQLNRLQAQAIQAQGTARERGPLRDAITHFDENGAILAAAPDVLSPLWNALHARDWQQAMITLRPLWDQAQLVLFGHALLEKLVHPRKAITAHLLALPLAPTQATSQPMDLPSLDALLAPVLQAQMLCAKPFTPLPVLGVPGWCADNGCISFYDDASVFRPARH